MTSIDTHLSSHSFHSNVLSPIFSKNSIVALPEGPIRGFQTVPNAPLRCFSPVIENDLEKEFVDIKMQTQIHATCESTTIRLSNKKEKLRRFRTVLEERVQEREKANKFQQRTQLDLFQEKEDRLLEHAKSICDDAQRQRNQSGVPAKGKTPTVLDLKWNRPTSELPASSTLLSSTTKSKSKTPLLHQLKKLNKDRSTIRSVLLACVIDPLPSSNISDVMSESSLPEDTQISTTVERRRRKEDLEKFTLTPKQKAHLVAAVRQSYMDVERNNVRSRDAAKQRVPERSPSKVRSKKGPANPAMMVPTLGIDVTTFEQVLVKGMDHGSPRSSYRGSSKKIISPKKNVSKATMQENTRYVNALQRIDASPALCACPLSPTKTTHEPKCANNCALYQNPKKAQQLVRSSASHKK